MGIDSPKSLTLLRCCWYLVGLRGSIRGSLGRAPGVKAPSLLEKNAQPRRNPHSNWRSRCFQVFASSYLDLVMYLKAVR